jgi:hypothetical protein
MSRYAQGYVGPAPTLAECDEMVRTGAQPREEPAWVTATNEQLGAEECSPVYIGTTLTRLCLYGIVGGLLLYAGYLLGATR